MLYLLKKLLLFLFFIGFLITGTVIFFVVGYIYRNNQNKNLSIPEVTKTNIMLKLTPSPTFPVTKIEQTFELFLNFEDHIKINHGGTLPLIEIVAHNKYDNQLNNEIILSLQNTTCNDSIYLKNNKLYANPSLLNIPQKICKLTVIAKNNDFDINSKDIQIMVNNQARKFLALGKNHSCVKKHDNTISCFGDNSYGQLNIPNNLYNIVSITAGDYYTCALMSNAKAQCFGKINERIEENNNDILSISAYNENLCWIYFDKSDGHNKIKCKANDAITAIPELDYPYFVVTGSTHACALHKNKELICWGLNMSDDKSTQALNIYAGEQVNCEVFSDGKKICTGLNSGNINENRDKISSLSFGENFYCILNFVGDVICYGDNFLGQTQVPTNTGRIISVASGANHSCIANTAGEVFCFGDNKFNQSTVPNNIKILPVEW